MTSPGEKVGGLCYYKYQRCVQSLIGSGAHRVTGHSFEKSTVGRLILSKPVDSTCNLEGYVYFAVRKNNLSPLAFRNPPPCACIMLPLVSVHAAPGTITVSATTR